MRLMNVCVLLAILLVCIAFSGGCAKTSPSQFKYTPTTMPSWISGQSGSAKLTAEGGTLPYHCSLKNNSALPYGFSLADDCTISGTAPVLASGTTKSISPPFMVIISDSSNPKNTAEAELTITTVLEAPKLVPVAGECTVKKQCAATIATATGGTPPYHYQLGSLAKGIAPPGTSVGLDGKITGVPQKEGTYFFEVCAVDVTGSSKCGITTVKVSPAKTPAGGLCSGDTDCASFGTRNCGGSSHALCGETDNLCHCCLLFVSGAGSSCLDCTTCGGGTYCERGTCVFSVGGKITD